MLFYIHGDMPPEFAQVIAATFLVISPFVAGVINFDESTSINRIEWVSFQAQSKCSKKKHET